MLFKVQREISILWLPSRLFGKSISVALYIWKYDTVTSASQQAQVQLSLESSSKLSALGLCMNLFTQKQIGILRTRPLLVGRGGTVCV